MQYYAHSLKDDFDHNKWEKLADHLRAVARRARTLAEAATDQKSELAAAAEVAGLLHDLGKYRSEWQAYLHSSAAGNDPPSVPHAIHGAAYAAFELDNLAITLAVAGHHAGLHDCQGIHGLAQNLTRDETSLKASIGQLTLAAQEVLGDISRRTLADPFPGDDDTNQRQREFWTRVLFSVLIDADRLETERFYSGGRPSGPRLDCGGLVAVLLTQLHTAKAAKVAQATGGTTNPNLLKLRNLIYDGCVSAAAQSCGFFELTVPTGGGKTLAGMAFALKHAEQHRLRRVIVVIPYLSIIEQNAQEYKTVLGSNNVVEHHSAVAEQEVKSEAGEPPRRTFAELATENWDAPVIVTTSVQFLETLLESSPRRCRKLHNVARSVILFDEAQSLPTHILNPLISVFRGLVGSFGCSVVFSTATQPAFRVGTGLTEGLKPEELKPILPPELVSTSFRSLQRVDYHSELSTTWDWDTLVDQLTGEGYSRGLCVLNTRKHAREVWEKLRERVADKQAVVHLSSAMCAEHRLAVLGDPQKPAPGSVRHRLRHGLPCWLVSTQVIEAGVDVDFPRVFRALGPLDSIVQVAGRCNREGGLKDAAGHPVRGKVVIFQPADEGLPRGLYQTATGKARTFLDEVVSEDLATKPEVFARYFDELYGVANCDAHGIQSKRKDFQFREVAEKARVINDGGRPVIVSYGASPSLIATIRSTGKFDRAVLRKLQRFAVNLRYGDWAELEQRTMIEPLLASCPDGSQVLHMAAYHNELGVVIANRPPEDFIF